MINIQTLLAKYRLKPSKALGQHYLVDEGVLATIIEAAQITKGEPVLEIGAGPGILTRALAEAGAEVLAVEFDRQFCRLLQEEFHNWRNVKVLCDDALRLDLSQLGRKKIVANIPYQITNPLIRKILEPTSSVETAVLLIQNEVADRLLAPPGSADRGILTLMLESAGQAEKIATIPPTAFWPAPKVNSAVIKITKTSNLEQTDQTGLIWLVKQGFSGKRKTLINSLAGSLRLPKSTTAAMIRHGGSNHQSDIVEAAGISALARAEDLTLNQWRQLLAAYQRQVGVDHQVGETREKES